MGALLGLNAKLYYKVGSHSTWAGTTGLTELKNCRNVTLNLTSGEADTTTRGNNGWKTTAATLNDASVEFEMVADSDDDGYTAMADAYFHKLDSSKYVSLAVLDNGSTTGSQGLWSAMTITNFSREEPLEGAQIVKVTAKPRYDTVPTDWVTVSGT